MCFEVILLAHIVLCMVADLVHCFACSEGKKAKEGNRQLKVEHCLLLCVATFSDSLEDNLITKYIRKLKRILLKIEEISWKVSCPFKRPTPATTSDLFVAGNIYGVLHANKGATIRRRKDTSKLPKRLAPDFKLLR